MQRTDIHRPSAEEFDPEQYEFRGCFDLGPDAYSGPWRIQLVNSLLDQGYRFTGVHGMGKCDHCGANVRYTALLSHEPTKGLIWIGEQCEGNRFSLSGPEFHRLRKESRLNRERTKKADRIAAVLAAMIAEVREAYEWALRYGAASGQELCGEGPAAYYAGKDWEDCTAEERTARKDRAWLTASDIAAKVEAYAKPLSERQEAFLVKLRSESLERARRRAEERAKVESGQIAACPSERVTIRGEVLSTKMVDSDFGSTLKMLVRDDSGFKVFGKVPAGLTGYGCGPEGGSLKGSRVEFSATCEPSRDDPAFGFFSRPTKARILDAEPEVLAA